MNKKNDSENPVHAATWTQAEEARKGKELPQRAHILIVDASSDHIDWLKKQYELANLPVEMPKTNQLSKEEHAELMSERRDEDPGFRPTFATKKGDLAIDDQLEHQALKEQNSKRLKARNSDTNPFRYCELEFMNSSNPNTVLARVRAGNPKIDAVITGLSVQGGKGNADYYGLEVAKKLAAQEFDGVVAITAAQGADSYTLQEEARKAGAIGLFDKHRILDTDRMSDTYNSTIFTKIREALQNRGQENTVG